MMWNPLVFLLRGIFDLLGLAGTIQQLLVTRAWSTTAWMMCSHHPELFTRLSVAEAMDQGEGVLGTLPLPTTDIATGLLIF